MNIAKYGASSVGKVLGHCARAQDEDGNYLTYDRKEGGGHIHRERTSLNYTIGECHDEAWINDRLKNVYQRPGQKGEPPRMLDVIVTLPKTEPNDPEHVRRFMDAAYKSLDRQFGGKNNVVGCWVHLDEAQPHLHFAFLPVADRKPSKKRPDVTEKLAVSAYLPRKSSLQEFHRQVQKDVDAALGHHVDLTFARSKDRDAYNKMTQAELKERTEQLQAKMDKMQHFFERIKDGDVQRIADGATRALGKVVVDSSDFKKLVEIGMLTETAHHTVEDARQQVRLAEDARARDKMAADEKVAAAEDHAIEADKRAVEAEERQEAAEGREREANASRDELERSTAVFRDAPDYAKEKFEEIRQNEIAYQQGVQRECVRAFLWQKRDLAATVKVMQPVLESIGVSGYEAQEGYIRQCLSAARSQGSRIYKQDKNGNWLKNKDGQLIKRKQPSGKGSGNRGGVGSGGSGGHGGSVGGWSAPPAKCDYTKDAKDDGWLGLGVVPLSAGPPSHMTWFDWLLLTDEEKQKKIEEMNEY